MKVFFGDIKRFIEKEHKEHEGGENSGKTTKSRDIMMGGIGVKWVYQKYCDQAKDKP